MGMFLRRGPVEKPVQTVDVTISGNTDTQYAYVEIDGTKYTAKGTYTIPVGVTAIVHCYNFFGTSGEYVSKITLNGKTVETAKKGNSTITYSFSVESSTAFAFSIKSVYGNANYFCDITTS